MIPWRAPASGSRSGPHSRSFPKCEANDDRPTMSPKLWLRSGESINRCRMDIKNRRNFPDGLPFRNKTLGQFSLIQSKFSRPPKLDASFLGRFASRAGTLSNQVAFKLSDACAVRAQARLESSEEFSNIIIRANSDGSFVRVKDVARIELGAQTYNVKGRLNGNPPRSWRSISFPAATRSPRPME